MALPRTPSRRRQRSVRVTVAVALMGVATVAVLAALPTQSPLLLSLASVLALGFAWSSLRIMWTEVLQSRRESALERTATASAYKSLFAERSAEHAEFTSAITERLAKSQMTMREIEGELAAAIQRAASAEARGTRDAKRLVETQERIEHLEQALAIRQAEEADALASWEADGGHDVVDLIKWDEQAARLVEDERKRA